MARKVTKNVFEAGIGINGVVESLQALLRLIDSVKHDEDRIIEGEKNKVFRNPRSNQVMPVENWIKRARLVVGLTLGKIIRHMFLAADISEKYAEIISEREARLHVIKDLIAEKGFENRPIEDAIDHSWDIEKSDTAWLGIHLLKLLELGEESDASDLIYDQMAKDFHGDLDSEIAEAITDLSVYIYDNYEFLDESLNTYNPYNTQVTNETRSISLLELTQYISRFTNILSDITRSDDDDFDTVNMYSKSSIGLRSICTYIGKIISTVISRLNILGIMNITSLGQSPASEVLLDFLQKHEMGDKVLIHNMLFTDYDNDTLHSLDVSLYPGDGETHLKGFMAELNKYESGILLFWDIIYPIARSKEFISDREILELIAGAIESDEELSKECFQDQLDRVIYMLGSLKDGVGPEEFRSKIKEAISDAVDRTTETLHKAKPKIFN